MLKTSYELAFSLAEKAVERLAATVNDEFEILPTQTKELEGGWVFFYNTAEFVRNGRFGSGLAGNGPILVTWNGVVHVLSSSALWAEEAKNICGQ